MKFSPNLKSRLAISSGALLLLSFFVALSQIKSLSWIFVVVLSTVVSFALFEFVSLSRKKDVFISAPILITATTFFYFARHLALVFPQLHFLPPFALFLMAISFALSTISTPQGSLARLTHSTFGFCFISLPLSWLIEIHSLSLFWFIWLIATVKGGDIAAYITGKTIGKHLLAPSVSPKKTIEGALATILGSALISISLSYFSSSPLPLRAFFSLGGTIGALGILGDLSESLIKRDANVKDSSTIPGLGGVLDILDSLLFTTPCLYFFLKISHLF